jgi:periplasmic protein TonB
MSRDLFQIDPRSSKGASRFAPLPFSIAAHALALGALVCVPLLVADALPLPNPRIVFIPPAAPPPPPAFRPAPPRTTTGASARPAVPTLVPTEIRPEVEPQLTQVGLPPGPFTDNPDPGIPGGDPAVAPTPPRPSPPSVRAPLPVGGAIKPPRKVRDVRPAYPPIAQQARVEGTVIIEAVIDSDGRVTRTRILRSVPLLDQAALAAVNGWVFTPTLLNGAPVPVVMTVTVEFRLH